MKPVGPIAEIYANARPKASRRVEKANGSSRLEEEKRRAASPAMMNTKMTLVRGASRFETPSSAHPLGEGIPASFLAQILGQNSSNNRADPDVCVRAYEQAQRPMPQLRFIRWT